MRRLQVRSPVFLPMGPCGSCILRLLLIADALVTPLPSIAPFDPHPSDLIHGVYTRRLHTPFFCPCLRALFALTLCVICRRCGNRRKGSGGSRSGGAAAGIQARCPRKARSAACCQAHGPERENGNAEQHGRVAGQV